MKYAGLLLMAVWLGIVGMPFHCATATPYDYQNPAEVGKDRAGAVYDGSGRSAGRISQDGRLTDARGVPVGQMDGDGFLYDAAGRSAGHVSRDGHLYDARGVMAGSVDVDGRVYGPSGASVGFILHDGTVQNASGQTVGHVPPADRTAGMLMLLGRLHG
ncbi:type IV secretion protein Rhs [Bombella sp. TMW 2.2559]|uniref:Type IV secretion protein Rhs n=1 Tax=Bombella dulcis TaxID=2967339 RepID=A0ABT3WD08_9PROT|nr:type IV secretion protein Rhs [Bombella dulcis]MCX5616975.1 type IV secretion protein Rhs [Bombella dulcis]